MTTLDFVDTTSISRSDRSDGAGSDGAAASASTLATLSRFGIRLIQLHDELWRVTRNSGEVLGYIESFIDRGTPRYRAKRMFSAQRPSLPLGEFWVIDDAVDCFRFS
ncbi:MAG: hypothetical protein JWQ39_42 [Glaciihabitans sp.]|nr:hypothetical protein [Glaciihabitans sp.]